jgi:hypothetical protein
MSASSSESSSLAARSTSEATLGSRAAIFESVWGGLMKGERGVMLRKVTTASIRSHVEIGRRTQRKRYKPAQQDTHTKVDCLNIVRLA